MMAFNLVASALHLQTKTNHQKINRDMSVENLLAAGYILVDAKI